MRIIISGFCEGSPYPEQKVIKTFKEDESNQVEDWINDHIRETYDEPVVEKYYNNIWIIEDNGLDFPEYIQILIV